MTRKRAPIALSRQAGFSLIEMVAAFLDTMPKAIAEIRTHIDGNDWASLAKAVHKIKPTLSLMGLGQARETAARIEHYAKEQINTGALAAETKAFCAQLDTALDELRTR